MSFLRERFYKPLRRVFERSKGLVGGDSVSSLFRSGGEKQPQNLKKYMDYYRTDSAIATAVDVKAEMIAGNGHYCTVEDEAEDEAVEICNGLAEKVRLDEKILNIVKCMFIYGFCPVERVVERGPPAGIKDLKILDPPTVKYVRDKKKGNITKFIQKVGTDKVEFKPDELIWFTYNIVGNSEGVFYGRSIVAPVHDKLETRKQIADNLNGIMKNQSRPPVIWKTNSKSDAATLKTILKDRDAEEDPVLYPKDAIDHEVVKVDTKTPYWEYIEYNDLLVFEGLHAPLLNYLRNATEASAKVMLEAVERHVQGVQRYVKRVVEHEVYEFHLNRQGWKGEIPSLSWGEPTTGVEDVSLDEVARLKETGVLSSMQAQELLQKLGVPIEPEEPPELEVPEEPESGEESPPFPFEHMHKNESGEYCFNCGVKPANIWAGLCFECANKLFVERREAIEETKSLNKKEQELRIKALKKIAESPKSA